VRLDDSTVIPRKARFGDLDLKNERISELYSLNKGMRWWFPNSAVSLLHLSPTWRA